jgi:hypothetical protein
MDQQLEHHAQVAYRLSTLYKAVVRGEDQAVAAEILTTLQGADIRNCFVSEIDKEEAFDLFFEYKTLVLDVTMAVA